MASSSSLSSLSSVSFPDRQRPRAVYEFGNAFASGNRPDLTVECEDEAWKVHTSVVCFRSAYFNAVCGRGSEENEDRRIVLHDEAPLPVALMLRYLYFADYHVPRPRHASGSDSDSDSAAAASVPACLDIHCKMLAMGDKYRLAGLKVLALDKFIAAATDPVTWRLPSHQPAAAHPLPLEQLPQLVSAVAAAYISPPDRRRMRPHVMPHVMRNLGLLRRVPEFTELQRLCEEFREDFREELGRARARAGARLRRGLSFE